MDRIRITQLWGQAVQVSLKRPCLFERSREGLSEPGGTVYQNIVAVDTITDLEAGLISYHFRMQRIN